MRGPRHLSRPRHRGIAWTDLHRALLGARADCVYFTATAGDPGKDADKDGWGAARNDAFFLRITPAETEQIMRELKGSGHYLARDLFRAGVEFSVEEVDLLGDGPAARAARERYDTAAGLCRDVSLAIRHFARMNARDKTAGLDRGLIQSYLKQLLFELRLDTVIRLAEEGLRQGRQMVISLHNVAGDAPQEEGVSAADTVRRLNTRLEAAINRLNTRHVEKAGEGDDVEYVDLGEIPEALLAREGFMERLMFPILAGHEVMCLWERERERLMTGEVAEMLAARRTGRSRGEVLRTTQLRANPVLTLYEVLNEAGERMALVQGYVTEYMVQIQRLRGPDPRTRLPKTRRYVQFTLSDGSGMISGLELTRWEALTVRDFFGEHDSEPPTPEEVWEALRTGANVSVQGPPGTEWVLHPRRNGLIEIRGASLTKHQRALAPLGKTVGFEPTTRYLFIRPERECVLRFLELFPPQSPVPESLEDAA